MLNQVDKDLRFVLHSTIKKVYEDIEERFNFNTAISSIMELVNAINHYRDKDNINRDLLGEVIESLITLLSFCAPYNRRNVAINRKKDSIHNQPWPKYDNEALKEKKGASHSS